MNKIMKSGTVIVAAVAISVAGASGSFADTASTPVATKVKLTSEQKVAFEAAKAQYQAARTARLAAIAKAQASIATAKSTLAAALAAATTKEARQVARAAFKGSVATARA